jgi:hypothetical protein
LKAVKVNDWCRLHGRGGNRRLSTGRCVLQLFLFSSVCTYTYRCTALCLLPIQASIHEMVKHKKKIQYTATWRPSFRAVVVSSGLSTMASESFSVSLSAVGCWRWADAVSYILIQIPNYYRQTIQIH